MNRRTRCALLAIPTLLAVLAPAGANAATETFDYTGGAQTWVVPAGITSATFDLYGAQGGTAFSASFGAGGQGGRATATLPVTPGESIEIRVGGAGGGLGGFNGGGAGGLPAYPGGGGGATDVRRGGSALADRVLVAGGGGGSGACASGGSGPSEGGAGGGLLGADAPPLTNVGCGDLAESGKGGTQSAGGAAGSGASAGTLGQGGDAFPGSGTFRGGGGGGYYGGGGGSGNQGGGGGSGFGPSGTTFQTGVRSGNGTVTVTFADRFDLTTSISGTGSGRVSSSPAGIDCHSGSPAGCSAGYISGTQVALTANPDSGSTFTGWSGGGCSGTAACTVKIAAATSVEASFADEPPVITSLEVSPKKFSPDPTPVATKKLGAKLTIGLSEDASVHLRVRRTPARKSGNPGSTARVFTRELGAGESSIPFSGTFRKTLVPGSYQVIAIATDSIGQRSEKSRAEFEVK